MSGIGMSTIVTVPLRTILCAAFLVSFQVADQWAVPAYAEEISRGPTYSTSLNFSPATRQALLLPPDVDPVAFAKAHSLPGYEIIRVPADFSTYGGWALISFQGTEDDAVNLCKDNPALKLCELDRCREFLPASESGFVPGLGDWRPEKEFTVAMAEGSRSSMDASASGTPGGSEVSVEVGPAAVAHTRDQPPTPEQFLRGESIGYGTDASQGPDLKTLPGASTSILRMSPSQETEVGSGWDQIVVRPQIGPPVVAKANDDVTGTTTRPPGGGTPTPPTTPRPPKAPVPPEKPEKPPDLSPPPPPPTSTPPEGQSEEILACRLFGGTGGETPGLGMKVGLPDVKEFIEPPPKEPGQEALNDPAIAGDHVWLHDLSFFTFAHDLFVKSVGVDFNATRFYRSNIKTKEGGLFGYNWDFGYYKRLIPQGGVLNPKFGVKVEGLMNPGPVHYMRGNGRVEEMKPNGVRFQMVKNFGGRFDAWVTYYKPPENLFSELERYVVLPNHPSPFAGHPNYEGDIFYVMRYGNGYREVYSCRGILLYILDRHDNRMTFEYDPVFHPLTFNPRLVKITDTAERTYSLEWKEIEGNGLVHTNYKGQIISGTFPKLRLKKIKEDFDGREAEYHYRGLDQQPVLDKAEERKDGSFVTRYSYAEQDTRYYLETLTLPRETAQGGDPYLKNQWRQDGDLKRIQSQTHGHAGTGTKTGGFEGGLTQFRWEGKPGSPVTVQSPRGREEVYTMEWTGLAYVIRRLDLKLDDGRTATTTIQHNASDQMTILTRPEGNRIEYQYAGAGGPVTEGPIRDCLNCGGGTGLVQSSPSGPSISSSSAGGGSAPTLGIAKGGTGGEGGVTYLNNLAKGNLTVRILDAGDRPNSLPYSSIITSYSYEPLYNQFKRIEGPGKAVTELEYDYFTKGAEGNPVVRRHPARTTATGETLSPVETTYEYTSTGLLLQETDPLNHKTVYAPSPAGYLLSVTDQADPQDNASFGRDVRGNMTKFVDARGTVTTLKVDQRDLVREKIEDDSEKGFKNRTTYQYDENGNLIHEQVTVQDNFPADSEFTGLPKQSFQLTKTYQYNLVNLQVKETQTAGALSRTRTQVYDAEGNLAFVQEPEGFTIAYYYDRLGNVSRKTFGGKLTEAYRYDLNGNLLEKKRGGSSTTAYEPDPFDRPYKTVTPEGTTVVTALNPDGTTQKIDIHGKNHEGRPVRLRFIEFRYDEIGDKIETKEHILGPDGYAAGLRTEQLVRDAEGKVLTVIDARKNHSTFKYAGHRKESDTDPLLNETHYVYEPGGLPTSITEIEREVIFREKDGQPKREEGTRHFVKTMAYDTLGRLSSFSVPGGSSAKLAYDSQGNLRAKVEHSGRMDLFEFDGFGRGVRDEQYANLEVDKLIVTRTYDLHDRLLASTVSRGERTINRTARTYDQAGLLKQLQEDSQTRVYTEFDDRGNPTREERSDGVKLAYAYDLEDRTKEIAVRYPGHASSGSTQDTFVYDGLGRIVEAGRYRGLIKNKLAYDSLGNPWWDEQIVGIRPLRLEYSYDSVGARTELRGPSIGQEPAWTITSERDHVGRVHILRHHASGESRSGQGVIYEFTGPTRLARRLIGGTDDTVYDYDAARRPVQARVYSSLGRVATFESQLDQESRPLSQASRITMPFDSRHTDEAAIDYTSWGVRAKVGSTFRWSDKPTDTSTDGTSRRLYRYQNDRVTEMFTSQEVHTSRPFLYGYLGNDAVSGELVKFLYDGNHLAKTEFWQHDDLPAGLSDIKLKAALADDAVKKQYTTWFRYDLNGLLSEDNRFRYEYDHGQFVSQVGDKYADSHYETGTVNYYYDYANRLVSIVYGGPVYRDRRFLYDGRLPFLEIRTDSNGAPKDVETAYVPHPEGIDVGPIRVRTHYDLRDTKEPPPSIVYPFFDLDGSLAFVRDVVSGQHLKVGQILDSAVRSDARRRQVILPRVEKDLRPEDLVALRPEHPRREIPLLSLHARWEPFMEAAFDLHTGKVSHDPLRNLELREKTAQQARTDYLHEQISTGQNNALTGMALLAAPVLLPYAVATAVQYPLATAASTALGVAIDMMVVEVLLKEEYGLDDLGQSIAMSAFFAGTGVMAKEFWKLRQSTRLFGELDELRHVRMTGKVRGSMEPGFSPGTPKTAPPVPRGPTAAAGRAAGAAEQAAASSTAGRSALPPAETFDPVGWPTWKSGKLVLFGFKEGDDLLKEFAKNLPPVPGVFDIFVHGNPGSVGIFDGVKWWALSPETIASVARAKGFRPGMVVRLISCNTGVGPKAFGKQLAEAMGTRVLAPNRAILGHPEGSFLLDVESLFQAQGEWLEFVPSRIRSMPRSTRSLWGDVPWLPR
jgi:YD repeat-containing protein